MCIIKKPFIVNTDPYPNTQKCSLAKYCKETDDDNITVQASNRTNHQKQDNKDVHKQHYGMLNSGTKGHFIVSSAKVLNINPTNTPIHVTIPDGITISSTHDCNLDWPGLSETATAGHIIPRLKTTL